MAAPTLSAGRIKEKVYDTLSGLFRSIQGHKSLVLYPHFFDLINIFFTLEDLESLNVEWPSRLGRPGVVYRQKDVVIVARGDDVGQVGDVVELAARLREEHIIHVFWISRQTTMAMDGLANAGLDTSVRSYDFPVYFTPVADDVLSLEITTAFTDLHRYKDGSSVFAMAEALMQIQFDIGLFPRITGKGKYAEQLVDLLVRMRREKQATSYAHLDPTAFDLTPSEKVESVVVVDRCIDFVSPMLLQVTYEGLLDDIVGVRVLSMTVPVSLVTADTGPAREQAAGVAVDNQTISLTEPPSALYADLRDGNIPIVNRRLAKELVDYKDAIENKDVVRLMQLDYNRALMHQKIIRQMIVVNPVIRLMPQVSAFQQALFQRSSSESLYQMWTDLVGRGLPFNMAVRLLCAESSMMGGLTAKKYDTVTQELVRAYGFQHAFTVANLDTVGLLQVQTARSTSKASTRRSFHLYTDSEDQLEPKDITYVYGQIAPLSVRFVQAVVEPDHLIALRREASTVQTFSDWFGFNDNIGDVVSDLPGGSYFDRVQLGDENATRAKRLLVATRSDRPEGGPQTQPSDQDRTDESKIVLVVYLGGITRAEIAAIRMISARLEKQQPSRRLVICTTNIITGNSIIGDLRARGKY